MRNPLRGVGFANVTATLALVVALGGTGYAAATIGTHDLKKNAVTSAKIKNGNVKPADIRSNAVSSPKIKDGTVKDADVADIAMHDLLLINSWTPYFADRGAKYGRDANGVVWLGGSVKQGGAFNSLIAVLPPGYRPKLGIVYLSTNLVSGAGPARIYIQPDGTVRVQATAPATSANAQSFTSLDGLSFVP